MSTLGIDDLVATVNLDRKRRIGCLGTGRYRDQD